MRNDKGETVSSGVISQELRNEILEHARECRNGQEACIDALQLVVDRHGWVSDDCIRELADMLGLTPEELDSTASFYNHVYRRPVGRHVILVCDSVSCWIMGYEGVKDYLSKRLGIGFGETTADGLFTMLPIQCLGACHEAPAMMVNDRLYCNLDQAKIDAILESYR